jgi:hypothetical protein
MSKARESFQIIQRMVSTAKASWAIWFQLYLNFEHGGPYSRVTQLYFPFMDAVYHSQIHYVFVVLNDLFKGGKNTHSLTYLIKMCRAEGLNERTAKECDALLASVQQHCRGVGILRGKHFGHKLIDAPLADLLKKAGLKIKDVDEMLDVATRIILWLMYALRVERHEVIVDADEHAKKTTVEVLQVLLDKFNSLGSASTRRKERNGPDPHQKND